MTMYRTRLRAALRSLGASEATVADVLAELPETTDTNLREDFGEPEDYARATLPETRRRQRYAFILAGTALALGVVLGQPVSSWRTGMSHVRDLPIVQAGVVDGHLEAAPDHRSSGVR